MKTTVFLLLLSFSAAIHAQDIARQWEDFKKGSPAQRVRACEALTRYYQGENVDSLRTLGEELFSYGIDKHYYPAIEQGKLTLASWFIKNGQAADGIAMAKSLLTNMEERDDDRMLSGTAGTIAIGYIIQQDGKSALYWAQRAQQYAKHNPDPLVRIESMQPMAEAYLLLNNTKQAIAAYKSYADTIRPFKSYRSLSAAYAKLGDIYRMEGDLKTATWYFRLSMKTAENSGSTIARAHAINNLGIISFEEGDTAKARKQFEEAMELRMSVNDRESVAASFYNMGEYYFYISDYGTAVKWYLQSIAYAKEHQLERAEADGYYALANLMKETSDFKGASESLEKYIELQKRIDVQNSLDDEEISELQLRIIRAEAQSEAKNADTFAKDSTAFKWEWLVIVILLITSAILLSVTLRKNSTS